MVGLAKAMGIRSRNLTSWKLLREGTSVDSQQGKKGRRKEIIKTRKEINKIKLKNNRKDQ